MSDWRRRSAPATSDRRRQRRRRASTVGRLLRQQGPRLRRRLWRRWQRWQQPGRRWRRQLSCPAVCCRSRTRPICRRRAPSTAGVLAAPVSPTTTTTTTTLVAPLDPVPCLPSCNNSTFHIISPPYPESMFRSPLSFPPESDCKFPFRFRLH